MGNGHHRQTMEIIEVAGCHLSSTLVRLKEQSPSIIMRFHLSTA